MISDKTKFSLGVVVILMGTAVAWGNLTTRVQTVEKEQDGTRKLLNRMNKSLGRIEGRLGIDPPAERSDSD